MTEETEIVQLRGMRAMIADKMMKSLQEAAQLTHHAECDASALMAAKAALGEGADKVSVEDLLMYCVTDSLGRHPGINGTISGKEVRLASGIHLSIAMALPGNLLVAPTILRADGKSIAELRAARQDLSARARTNKLSVTEMTGGTFTISNLGLTRVHHFTPILNTPQIAILGIGCIEERAFRSADGAVDWRPMMGLSLTFDHRAIDGAPAVDFLSDLCQTIEGMS